MSKVLSDVCAGNVDQALASLNVLLNATEGILNNLKNAKINIQLQAEIPPEISRKISETCDELASLVTSSTAMLAMFETEKNKLLAASEAAINTCCNEVTAFLTGLVPTSIINQVNDIIRSMSSNMVAEITALLTGLIPEAQLLTLIAMVNDFLNVEITIEIVPPSVQAILDSLNSQIDVLEQQVTSIKAQLRAATQCML